VTGFDATTNQGEQMKTRVLVLMLGLAVLTAFSNAALAEEMPEMGNENPGGQGQGQGPGSKPKMMHQPPSLLATSDGGVVVMAGPRLIKYDKDLTLVNEVELPRGKGPGQRQPESSNGEPQAAEA
jgi:hypothetical protein